MVAAVAQADFAHKPLPLPVERHTRSQSAQVVRVEQAEMLGQTVQILYFLRLLPRVAEQAVVRISTGQTADRAAVQELRPQLAHQQVEHHPQQQHLPKVSMAAMVLVAPT
jgi:hypothetical protein